MHGKQTTCIASQVPMTITIYTVAIKTKCALIATTLYSDLRCGTVEVHANHSNKGVINILQ